MQTGAGLPRAFWVLWTGQLVNRMAFFFEPFLALYLTGPGGLSATRAGLVLALVGAGSIAGQLGGGILSDRLGPRPTLVISLVGSAIAVVTLSLTRRVVALALVAFAASVLVDLFRPAGNALIADLLPARDRVRGYALVYWAINVGFAAGALLGGTLAGRSYTLLFAVDAATSLAFVVLLLAAVPPRPHHRAGGEAGGGIGTVLRDRLLLALVGIQVVHASVYLQAFTTLPLAVRDAGLGASSYGAIIALNGALIVVAQPFLVAWMGRRDRPKLLAISSLVLGAGFGINALGESVSVFALSVVVWTVGEIFGAAVASALIAELAPAGLRGRYMGVFSSAWGIAAVLAPLVGTTVYQHAGADVLWPACTVAGAVAAAAVLWLRPALGSRLAAAQPM